MYCLDTSFLLNFLEPSRENHRAAVLFYQANKNKPMAIPMVAQWEVIRGELANGSRSSTEQVDEMLRTWFIVFPMSESIRYETCEFLPSYSKSASRSTV